MNELPHVTVIIPCRNEEYYIEKCIDSIISNDYPKDKLEIFFVDGMSDDKTRDIIKKYSEQYSFINLLENSKKIVPSALNIGVHNARGEIIIRLDAHAAYPKDYLSKCIMYLNKYNVDNVGGIWITMPSSDTVLAKSIAMALSHPFGVGNAYFRIGLKEPKYVDTVPFGCYRKEVFDRIGLFNENLVRNQDIEFNLRLKNSGGKILLVPEIVSYYYARASLNNLARNNFANGLWVIYSSKFADLPFSVRHLIPLVFVLSVFGSLIGAAVYYPLIYLFYSIMTAYLVASTVFAIKISLRKGWEFIPLLVVTFYTLHFSYGLGSIWGFIKLMNSKFKLL